MKKQDKEVKLCSCLKSVAHPVRFSILTLLRDQELNVGEIEKQLKNVNQSNLSQHLGMLYKKGALKRRREGNQIFYSVADKRIFKLIDLITEIFCRKENK